MLGRAEKLDPTYACAPALAPTTARASALIRATRLANPFDRCDARFSFSPSPLNTATRAPLYTETQNRV
jgi:hypothetical protein